MISVSKEVTLTVRRRRFELHGDVKGAFCSGVKRGAEVSHPSIMLARAEDELSGRGAAPRPADG